MANTYRPADIPEQLAQPLIQNHHSHLADARIKWLFSTGSQSKASVCPALLRYAFGKDASGITPDFVVVVADRDWSSRNPDARNAFVDELLCRMGQETNQSSGADKWIINKPDVSLFLAVVKRHGLQTTEQRQVGRIIQNLPEQLRLLIDDATQDTSDLDDDLAGEDDEESWETATRPELNDQAVREIRGSVEAAVK